MFLKLDAKILIIIILATMPFLKTIVNDNSKIGLWEINESIPVINEIAEKLDENIQLNNFADYKFDEKDFRLNMLEDQMASEKLSEGITGFSKAIEELEELLFKRLSEIKNQKLISAN